MEAQYRNITDAKEKIQFRNDELKKDIDYKSVNFNPKNSQKKHHEALLDLENELYKLREGANEMHQGISEKNIDLDALKEENYVADA